MLATDPLLDILATLKSKAEPFAVATVVRTEDATSAKAGAKALIREDGTMEGWIGGGCVQGAARRAALLTLADGQARLIRVGPKEMLDAQGVAPGGSAHGVEHHVSHCPSGGTVDLFIEPILPAPRLVVLGDTPVARALVDLGLRLGYAVAAAVVPEEQGFVIVATQGRGDQVALRSALESAARYVGFIGSRKKSAALKATLHAQGVPAETLGRLRAPAGLSLGGITPDEIALSVLAEIVQELRRRVRLGAGG